MTPNQIAVSEILLGIMEAFFSQHRSDFASLDVCEDSDRATVTIEGITSDHGARFFFEVKSQGSVGGWYVRPVRTVQMGYVLNAVAKAVEVLRNAK